MRLDAVAVRVLELAFAQAPVAHGESDWTVEWKDGRVMAVKPCETSPTRLPVRIRVTRSTAEEELALERAA